MFFVGKNDRRFADDFRGELHDSDGLLMHTGAGEWIWRPLSNPAAPERFGLPRHQPARLRAPAARPQLQRLPGPRSRLRTEAELLDRAARGLGRGQGGAARAADQRRDQRQHRRRLGAEGRARRRQVARLRLPHHRADDGSEPDAGRPHGRDVPRRAARARRGRAAAARRDALPDRLLRRRPCPTT